jgi:hypothetical protein
MVFATCDWATTIAIATQDWLNNLLLSLVTVTPLNMGTREAPINIAAVTMKQWTINQCQLQDLLLERAQLPKPMQIQAWDSFILCQNKIIIKIRAWPSIHWWARFWAFFAHSQASIDVNSSWRPGKNCNCNEEFTPVAAVGPSRAKDRPIQHWGSGRPGCSVQEQRRRKCKRPAPKIRCASQHSHDGGPKQLFARIYAPLAHYIHSPLRGARKEQQGFRKQEMYYKHGQRRNVGCNEGNLPDLQNSDMVVDKQSRRIAERQDHFYLAWLQRSEGARLQTPSGSSGQQSVCKMQRPLPHML